MNLRKILLIAGIASVAIYAVAGLITPEIKWEQVHGIVSKDGAKLYVDSSSQAQQVIDKSLISSADFLLTFEKPISIIVDGKILQIRSMIKSLIVDCGTRVSSPVYDMYFVDTIKPTGESEPAALKVYDVAHPIYMQMEKKSPVFQTLCPILA